MGVEFGYRAPMDETSLSLSAPYSFQAGGKVGIVGKKAGGLADARHIHKLDIHNMYTLLQLFQMG